jgi:hypothetical protein
MSDDQSENDQRFAADLLRGAARIAAYLKELGEEVEPEDIYYIKKSGKYPIGRHGRELIASKRQLMRHAKKISFVS